MLNSVTAFTCRNSFQYEICFWTNFGNFGSFMELQKASFFLWIVGMVVNVDLAQFASRLTGSFLSPTLPFSHYL